MSTALFTRYPLSGRYCPNRFAAQAMEINSADEGGRAGDAVLDRYRQLARGAWGLVFSEAVAVDAGALARLHGLVLDRGSLDSFKRLVGAFKRINEKSPFIIQLNHPGRNNYDTAKRIKAFHDGLDDVPVAAEHEIDRIREAFVGAAALAFEAGADGVDIKACHGYFGGELLRPANSRSDRYGGSREGRAFFLSSVIGEVKSRFPRRIVGSRISLYEGIRGGCGTSSPDELIEDLDDMIALLKIIAGAGADFFNVSAGIPVLTPMLTRPEAKSSLLMLDHFRYTKTVKREFPGIAVIGSAYSAGTRGSQALAEDNVARGYADFAGFGRQNLADPLFPEKAATAPERIDYCTLCGGCSRLLKEQKRVFCTVYRRNGGA